MCRHFESAIQRLVEFSRWNLLKRIPLDKMRQWHSPHAEKSRINAENADVCYWKRRLFGAGSVTGGGGLRALVYQTMMSCDISCINASGLL